MCSGGGRLFFMFLFCFVLFCFCVCVCVCLNPFSKASLYDLKILL